MLDRKVTRVTKVPSEPPVRLDQLAPKGSQALKVSRVQQEPRDSPVRGLQ